MTRYSSALAAVLALTGCTASQQGPFAPVGTGAYAVAKSPVVLLGQRVQASVTSTGFQHSNTDDGRLVQLTTLQNHEERRLQVQARCVYRDAQGFTVDEGPFEDVFLDPHGEQPVRCTALSTKVVAVTVQVREAQ